MEILIKHSDSIRAMIEGPWKKDPNIFNDVKHFVDKAVEFYTNNTVDLSDWDSLSIAEFHSFADQWLLEALAMHLLKHQMSLLKKKLNIPHVVCVNYVNNHYIEDRFDPVEETTSFWFTIPSSLLPVFKKVLKYWDFDTYGVDKLVLKRKDIELSCSKEDALLLKSKIDLGTYHADNYICYSCYHYHMSGVHRLFCDECESRTMMPVHNGIATIHTMNYYFVMTDEERSFYDQEMLSDKNIISTVFKWDIKMIPSRNYEIGKQEVAYYCNSQSLLHCIKKEELVDLTIDGITFM